MHCFILLEMDYDYCCRSKLYQVINLYQKEHPSNQNKNITIHLQLHCLIFPPQKKPPKKRIENTSDPNSDLSCILVCVGRYFRPLVVEGIPKKTSSSKLPTGCVKKTPNYLEHMFNCQSMKWPGALRPNPPKVLWIMSLTWRKQQALEMKQQII